MLLTIEKLVYGGDGLARLPAEESTTPARATPERAGEPGQGRGKAVFVPFTLAGEQVEATIGGHKPGFARARLERVVAPSAQRIDPACPYFLRCGGCHYQHTGYEHQIEIKTAILRENLARLAKLDWPGEIVAHRSQPWNYRNRARLQVRHQPEFSLGYYAHGSHHVVPVEQCPISSPLINRALAGLCKFGREGGFAPAFREVELFADASDEQLSLAFHVDASRVPSDGVVGIDGEKLRRELPEMAGMSLFATEPASKPSREPRLVGSVAAQTDAKSGQGASLLYAVVGTHYRVSPGAFFQTNRFLADKMVELVTGGRAGKLALDLYAGVGLFATVLARSFERVVAVEASEFSVADLKHNVPANVEVVRDTTERYLARRSGQPDLVVADPPRAGLGDKVVSALGKLGAPRLTYLSCDPATLARDLRGLIAAGYRVEEIHLLDLFPQTYHIESLVQLVK